MTAPSPNQRPENIKRSIAPSIYALLLEGHGTVYLSIQFAYNLEDAFSMAQNEFIRQNSKLPIEIMQGAKINLFAIKTIEQLVNDTKPVNEVKVEEVKLPIVNDKVSEVKEEILDKNSLMKLIIESKNKKLLNSKKAMFTATELKFLRNKLK